MEKPKEVCVLRISVTGGSWGCMCERVLDDPAVLHDTRSFLGFLAAVVGHLFAGPAHDRPVDYLSVKLVGLPVSVAKLIGASLPPASEDAARFFQDWHVESYSADAWRRSCGNGEAE